MRLPSGSEMVRVPLDLMAAICCLWSRRAVFERLAVRMVRRALEPRDAAVAISTSWPESPGMWRNMGSPAMDLKESWLR